jgi:hypothetical protein
MRGSLVILLFCCLQKTACPQESIWGNVRANGWYGKQYGHLSLALRGIELPAGCEFLPGAI